MYTTEEKIQIISWYLSGNSLRTVRDLFSITYTERPIPCVATIQKIIQKFQTEGCSISGHRKRNRNSPVLDEDTKLQILCAVEENPTSSLQKVANYINISKSSVRKTLKEFKYKAYKFSNHHELLDADMENRTIFCERLFNLVNEQEGVLSKILFTDEATFTLNGEVNSQNFR